MQSIVSVDSIHGCNVGSVNGVICVIESENNFGLQQGCHANLTFGFESRIPQVTDAEKRPSTAFYQERNRFYKEVKIIITGVKSEDCKRSSAFGRS